MKENKSSEKQLNLSEVMPSVVQQMIASCNTEKCFQHLEATPIPSRDAVAGSIHQARRILFPGYFTESVLAPSNLEYCLKEDMTALYKALVKQIIFATQHDCMRLEQPCAACQESGRAKALEFIQALPRLREILATDVRAAMEGGVVIEPLTERILGRVPASPIVDPVGGQTIVPTYGPAVLARIGQDLVERYG